MTVRDQFGSAVVGAEIALAKPGEKARTVITDENGAARIAKLGPGEYEMVVTAIGFKEFKLAGVAVRAGGTQKVEAVLDVAPIESNVDVGENEAVNAENPGSLVVMTEKDVENLPDNQEELERAIRRLGETVSGEELPVSVNGVQGGKIPPKAAIQQIRVNQNVFSAQYDSPWGGGIEIFTRSNVDRFRSYLSFSFADSRLNAADPFIGRRVPFQSRSYFGNISGPLFSKKANFMIYGSRSESDSSSVINAIVLGDGLLPVEFKQTLSTPSRSENVTLLVNADPNKKHKLYLNYSLSTARSENQNTGGFSLPSRANDNRFHSHWLQFSDTYLMNPNIVNQTRFVLADTKSRSFGGSDDPAINVLDAFFGGGSQQNSENRNLRFEVSNDTTWQMGNYSLGFGVRFRGERIDQSSLANFGGTYTFGGRLAPVLDAANNPVLNNDGTVQLTQIDSLESYRRTLLLQQLGFSPQAIRQRGGGPTQFTISGGNPDIDISQYDSGVYVQNGYKVSETIAVSFGLRYEHQSNISSNFNLAPRFGIIWAPKAKDKQNPLYTLPRISVGYGVFYSRFAINNTLTARLASDPGRLQYFVTDADILDLYPTVPTLGLLDQFALARTSRIIDDRLQTPYQSLLNITATKKLPKGFTLNATYARGKNFRLTWTQNINAPFAGTYDPFEPSLAVRPFGNVGNIYESRSAGNSITERISINIGLPQSQKLFGNLRYSWGRSKSSVVSGSGSPFDPYDFTREFGPTPSDGVHSAGGYFYYNLPRRISIGGDLSVNSGSRFNITTGRDTNGDGFFSERPAYAKYPNKPGVVQTPYGLLDPSPSPGDELVPRNLGRGPMSVIFNANISKSFAFNENKEKKQPPKQTLNFSLRMNNVLNIINKGNPIANMASPNFLRTLSSYSDGGVVIINGQRQENFPGRSMSLSVGFGF